MKGWNLPAPLAAGVLAGVALMLYWGSLRHPLVFDDLHLTEQALRGRYADAAARLQLRWLSDASFGWVRAAFGADLVWQRLVNVLLHAATAIALFGFVSRLRSRGVAFAGALLFVAHPVAVYAVAYLMQRSILLATLFSVIALWCVLEALLRGSRAWYAAAFLAYVLAVSSKEHAVMLPAVAVALVVLMRGFSWRLVLLALVPCALVALYLAFKSRALLGSPYEPLAQDFGVALAWPLSALNQAALFFRYLATWLLPWPGWMSIDIRPGFPTGLLDGRYLLAAIAWLGFGAGGLFLLLRGKLAGFALLAPWLLSFTEFSTARIQETFVLYRSYLWMALPVALLPALAARLPRRALAAAVAAALVLLVPAALNRLESFSTPLKLWDDAVAKSGDSTAPGAERTYVARGIVLLDRGELSRAAQDFERAIAINARAPDGYLGLATARLRAGQAREARALLDRALELDPRYGAAYAKRCVVRMQLGNAPQALADCEKAVEINPADHEAWANAGVIYRELGRRQEAEASYRRALELQPLDASANYNYAVLLLDAGKNEAAAEHLNIACRRRLKDACRLLGR